MGRVTAYYIFPAILAITLATVWLRGMGNSNKTVTYKGADGKSITATFHLPEDALVDIRLNDGRTMTLAHALSASGTRYANPDESFVFWNKGTTAFIQENDIPTFSDCNQQ